MQTIQELFDKLFSIADTASTKEKQRIISELKNDKEVVDVLYFLINPYITTGLSSKKILKKVLVPPNEEFNSLLEVISYLTENNTGTDQVISNVQNFANKYDPMDKAMLYSLFTKSLKLGATAKTFNKVIPDFVPTFNVQLAYKYEDHIKSLSGKQIIATLKLDGVRCICINDTTPTFFTRSGQEITDLIELKEEFKKLPKGVYDGELLATGKFDSNGHRFLETIGRARLKGVKTGLKMICFDFIQDINKFKEGFDDTPYHSRVARLGLNLINMNGENRSELIGSLPLLYVGTFDPEEVARLSKQAALNKEEGIMINVHNSPYECKRTKNLLKVKRFHSVDLRVTGFEEGTGEFTGMLGSLEVSYKGHKVNVGSGFTHKQREELWQDRYEMIGKIIEINYFEETTTDNGISLRFPTFVCVRDDKNEESYN